MTKQQLRKHYTALRRQLSHAEYDLLNQQLLQQFQTLNLTGVDCIHLFWPALERREPDTLLIRKWLKATHPNIKRVFPKADFASFTMQSYADDELLQLTTNSFGITEPVAGTLVDDKQIDLIIVPLLTIDRQGYRVGYGKGFYDRLIAQCRPDVRLAGLSFFEPVKQIDDLHEFDVPLQLCVLPDKVIQLSHSER